MRKEKWMKKLISLLMAVCLLLSSVPMLGTVSVQASEEFRADDNLLAHYPLESDAKDVSGNDQDAVITEGASGVSFTGDALNLAGGDKNSKNYVTLPDGLFDNQDTVTVSMWINNKNTKGNYSAFFFGSAAVNNLPSNYFLLNPCSPSGNYKAVFTDSVNAGSPWTTEKGVNDSTNKTPTSGFMNQWKLYTIVISNKTLTAYLDGTKLGTVALTRQISDFGTGLKAHIGKSQYLSDSLFAGSFRDLRIYNTALDDEDVQALYQSGVSRNKLLEDKMTLSIGNTSNIIGDLTLPAAGKNGSVVTWSSDTPSVVGNDGQVIMSETAQTATLTATLMMDGDTVTRTFDVTVAALGDVEEIIKDRVEIPYVVTEKTPLPTSFEGGIHVTWDDGAENLIAADGKVTASADNKEIDVTATITYGENTYTRLFRILVMEKTAEYVMSYTRSGVNAGLGQSMHLACSADGESYTALHNNTGIFFTKADLTTSIAGTTKTLVTPYLFRMADRKVGVIAVRNDGKIICATTENLMDYEEQLITLNTELTVSEPRCEYNGIQYEITWKGSDGKLYRNVTEDFTDISEPEEIISRAEVSLHTDIANAVPCSVLPITKEEADGLRAKLLPLENTGIQEKTYSFEVEAGGKLTEEDTKSTITAKYSDGTTDEIPITWNMSQVNFNKEGVYEITGEAKLTSYPVLNGRADPDIFRYKGKYYFIATGETQNQSQVCIREADTPLGLFTAQDHELIPNVQKPRWAPELHEIGGKLYIFLAIGDSWKQVQSCIMELKEGGNPTVKEDWKEAVRVTKKDGSALYSDGITLDMTYFEVNGTHYISWAQREISNINGTSDLWIATIDPSNPYRLTSDPVCITRCQYGWDRMGATVDEGPYVLCKDGKVYMTFSGGSVSNYYVVGLLTASEGDDLLNPDSWKETGYPILSSESVQGEYGPGHSCFSVDEDGREIFVYHMKPNGGTRSATVRRVHWGADGAPVLDMTADKELKQDYRTVKGTVTVKKGTEEPQEPKLLAHYPLASDGKDISGNGNHAIISEDASGVTFDKEALNLSGGNSSSKNYAALPTGLFDQQNALTISMWIKNNHTKKNTSAFSFCGTTKQGSYPKHYFILNPSNPDGYYKAVFTDPAAGSTANPWTTEVGVNNSKNNSISTADQMEQWMYYTVTIGTDRITGYLNGELVGTDKISNMTVSDFGKGIVGYIGKSDYADDTFAGSFRDVRIYDQEMNGAEVAGLYQDAQKIQKVKEVKLALQAGDGVDVAGSLTLPTESEDCTIVWKSSDPSLIENDGTVHFKDAAQKVTLTAVVTNGTYSEQREFELTVASKADADSAQYRMGLTIPRYISRNLQNTVNGKAVVWECSKEGLIAEDGTVTRPKKDTKVTVKAVIDGVTVTREATVMAEGGQILSYVIQGGNLYQNTGDLLAAADSRRSDALFLAAKTKEETSYTELNKGKAILYVRWSGDQKTNPDNQMGSPILFRKADGSLAAAASGNNQKNGIYVWDSKADMTFTGERFLTLAQTGKKVQNPSILYDEMVGAYKVFWQDESGTSYVSLMADLEAGTKPLATTEAPYEKAALSGEIPKQAVKEETSVFEASAEEYAAITKKYAAVYNTEVEEVRVTARSGDKITLPETVKASYSDGSTKNLGVIWNEEVLKSIDSSKPGTYEITGTVQQDAYAYPFIEERADPHVFYNEDDGYYYSTGSYYEENMTAPSCAQSYRKLDIRRAKTIEGLKTAEEHYILESKTGDRWGGFIWAPEFHKINGTWYCLVGAHDFGTSGVPENVNWSSAKWCSKSILIPYKGTKEQMVAGGMLDATQWGDPIILNNAPSFDVSYYEDENGQGYYVMPQSAQISLVKVQGGEGVIPQPTGAKVVIKSGEWPWEYGIYEGSITSSNQEGNDQLVVEGPYMFSYGDKVYISYSAATVDKFYTLGLMMADKGSDLMNPDSWTHVTYPLLSSYDTDEGEIGGGAHVGGGHNSVVLDEYGNLALVYHARPYPDPHAGMSGSGGLYDPCRHTVVKGIHVAADGTLIFNMTAEEELNPKYKNIKATVTIENDVQTLPYVDVAEDDWYYEAAAYNYNQGFMTGLDKTHFGPEEKLPRAHFAAILYAMSGKPDGMYENPFKDVEEKMWYTDAVLWANKTGVVTGYTGEVFGPADSITREQMAVMLYRYAGYLGYDTDKKAELDRFDDAEKVSGFARDAMEWAVEHGIISGKGKGAILDPQGSTSRSECAAVIWRFRKAYAE